MIISSSELLVVWPSAETGTASRIVKARTGDNDLCRFAISFNQSYSEPSQDGMVVRLT
jgi:hypothetical protein